MKYYNMKEMIIMTEKERLELENELLTICSKAQAINKYIDELEENIILTNQLYKLQQEIKELNQKYLNAVTDYETTMSELRELKKEKQKLKEIIKNLKYIDNDFWQNDLTESDFDE